MLFLFKPPTPIALNLATATTIDVGADRPNYATPLVLYGLAVVEFENNFYQHFVKGIIPYDYDYADVTYVAAGNGAGEIETVTCYTGGSGGTQLCVLTCGYDANDDLISIERT